ncbi:MAG TPA: Crp/Fnr family transcriptional regulator [Xanthobacteraceae bacterium]
MVEPNRTTLDKARRLLGNCDLFRGLKADERNAIIKQARIRNVAAGDRIFSIGTPGDHMVAVLAGQIRITLPSSNGRELLLGVLEPGELFGEIALLDGRERTADATAGTASVLAILERHDVLSFLERNPAAWLKIVEILCGRIRQADVQLAEVALMRLPARLAKAILRIVSNQPKTAAGYKKSHVLLTQQELANMVGARRETVNKNLRAWHRQGLVKIDDGRIAVTDWSGLELIAELD